MENDEQSIAKANLQFARSLGEALAKANLNNQLGLQGSQQNIYGGSLGNIGLAHHQNKNPYVVRCVVASSVPKDEETTEKPKEIDIMAVTRSICK